MPRILLHNARLIDPSQGLDRHGSILIEEDRVAGYDASPDGCDETIDCQGKIVCPGLVDIHTQLREPGREEDETIQTGAAAAVAGGFTSIACLPNTDPPIDTPAQVEFVRQKAARAGLCNVFVVACVSKGREGKELSEIGSLVEAGAVAFSDAMHPIHNAELMRRALQYCLMFDKPVFNHPEMLDLSRDGLMHDGETSLVLGLPGMPAEAEDLMTARDIRLSQATGGRLHLTNVSTTGSVEQIRRAKERGVNVTAATCPHLLAMTDERLRTFDSNYKVIPPLRSADHQQSLIEGLKDGAIDVLASGHAPRSLEKKLQELDRAPFGMVALETALSLAVTFLIQPGHLDWPGLIAKMTINPARVLGVSKGTLTIGADADIAVIDPDAWWKVDAKRLRSKSQNTPLDGWDLCGKVERVMVGGRFRDLDS